MIRIAFVKYAGLGTGGTERWLQTIAAHLPREEFAVDYYYADAAPYIGSSEVVGGTDPHRIAWMREKGVNLIEFHVEAVDARTIEKRWVGSDFWEVFDPSRYDLVQTAKEGLPEYPFRDLPLPVFEQVAYTAGVDRSANTVRSGFWSQWHRGWWARRGGDVRRSFVSPIPVAPPATSSDLRSELAIPSDATVVGFHQRPSDAIFSPMQLAAVHDVRRPDLHVVVLGGSSRYREQAADLGLPNTHFLDTTGDAHRISAFLNTLDVFIHGRRDGETFGSVLSEALIHGVPCISHRVRRGGNAQHETIGPAGKVVDSVDDYAATLEFMLRNADMRARLGEKGKTHAMARYTLDAAIDEMISQYRRFAAGEPPVSGGDALLPYGEDPRGVLLAGPVDDPGHPASSVLTGRPLRRAGVAIATKAGREAGRVVEVGAQRALLSLFAASADERVVAQIVDVDSGQRGARFAVWLNGLEDRVRVIAEDELDVSGRFVLAVSSEPPAMRWLGLHIGNLASHIECIVSEVALPRHVDEAIRARGFTLVRLGAERGYVRHGITMRRLRRRTQRFVAADAAARLSSRAVRMVEPLRARIRGPLVARAALLRQRVSVGSRNGRS